MCPPVLLFAAILLLLCVLYLGTAVIREKNTSYEGVHC